MTEETPRLGLPLLVPGQAQKELIHNEALMLADMLVQSVVEAVLSGGPPANPEPGQCWIIGTSPSGEWSGKAGWLACFSGAGWRLAAPHQGMAVMDRSNGLTLRHDGQDWIAGEINATLVRIGGNPVLGPRQAAISAPSGGSVADAESRIAIGAILSAMRAHGLIAS